MVTGETSPTSSCRIIVLDNIRSAHNVGAIFRTADAAGIDHIFLVGHTPKPIDRFGRSVSTIEKTALGAEQAVPWTHVVDYDTLLNELKKRKVELLVVEQTSDACSIYTFQAPPRVAYIFGNEITGVSERLCRASRRSIYIPMLGVKESLNVSVSVGITIYVLHPMRYDMDVSQ